MKIRLLKPYGLSAAGDILDPAPPVAKLLIYDGRAEAVDSSDPDADGKDEGGAEGEKKAFSRPPTAKKAKR